VRPLFFAGTWYEIPVYFAIYMLAFLGAILLASHRARRFNLSPVTAIDAGMISFLSGFLGARIFHILIEYPKYYFENPLKVLMFWPGGFVLYGGLVFGVIGVYSFLKSKAEFLRDWADLLAPSLLFGIGIGRMACLAAGCCYGKATNWWWGIIFTDQHAAAPLHISLHPTQLLEAVFGLLMAGVFILIWNKPKKYSGFALPIAFLAYAGFRFFIEFLRADPERGFWFGGAASTSQIIAMGSAVICIAIILNFIWGYRSGRLQPGKTFKAV